MSGLEERGGSCHVHFRHHGKRRTLTPGKVSKDEAEAKSAQVDHLLVRLKQRLIEMPPGIDIVEFVQHGGKPPSAAAGLTAETRSLTLIDFHDR